MDSKIRDEIAAYLHDKGVTLASDVQISGAYNEYMKFKNSKPQAELPAPELVSVIEPVIVVAKDDELPDFDPVPRKSRKK